MGKKDLKSVTSDLAGLAQSFPTQRAPTAPASLAVVHIDPTPVAKRPTSAEQEREVQLCFFVRTSLRKELAQLAAAANHDTVRGFVLAALKDKGLSVSDADLVDRRRRS